MAIYDIHGNALATGSSGAADSSLLWNLTKWKGKHLVVDGNSLVKATNWGQYTAEMLGMVYHNLGLSGSNIVHGQTTMEGIKGLVADEFPAHADLIILQGDSNTGDITDFDPADQMDGENPKNTWAARTNYLIRCLKAKYPNVVIVLMADSVRYDSYRNGTQYSQNPPAPNIYYEPNRNNYEAMKKIAEYNRHHFWSFDGDTPFNPTNAGNEYVIKCSPDFVINDGTHPGGYFAKAKGYALAWWIGQLTYYPDASNAEVEGWENLVTAAVTNNLTGVTNSNAAANIQYYMPYVTTLNPVPASVTVTMGGVDVTDTQYSSTPKALYENGEIRIRRVTGDVVITASA